MALYVKPIICAFCGKEIKDQSSATHLPQFVWNQMDPLFRFGDALVHDDCLRSDPLAPQVKQRLEEFRNRTADANRRCLICGELITDPEDYLGLGYLTADATDPLFRFNYAHFHRSHLTGWSDLPLLIRELDRFDRSGNWKGGGLKQLINELRKADPALGSASPA